MTRSNVETFNSRHYTNHHGGRHSYHNNGWYGGRSSWYNPYWWNPYYWWYPYNYPTVYVNDDTFENKPSEHQAVPNTELNTNIILIMIIFVLLVVILMS